ncbi:hypothetical protein ACTFIW_003762 [Dictyostelium discoideum]
MSNNNVINPVYPIHGTHEVQLEYLRSILDSNILSLLKMVVPDWLQTDVAIKLNTQTDITELQKVSKVVLKKIRSRFIVYRESKGHCLNCGKANHKTSTCGVDPVNSKVYPVGKSAQEATMTR